MLKKTIKEQRYKKDMKYTEHKRKMAAVNPTISIIILNVNGLNNPIKGGECQNGDKQELLHAVQRRHTLDSKIQAD